jgi:hypothetical protein
MKLLNRLYLHNLFNNFKYTLDSYIRFQFAYGASNTIFSLVSGGQYLVQVEELLF